MGSCLAREITSAFLYMGGEAQQEKVGKGIHTSLQM
jgi:hypothetical protein